MKGKKILGIILLVALLTNIFVLPVSAKEAINSLQNDTTISSMPSNINTYTHAGTIYRYGSNNLSFGRINVYADTRLYVYLPDNNGSDWVQGKIYLRNIRTGESKEISIGNYATETWSYTLSNYVSTGTYDISFYGQATGTSQKAEVFYKYE